MEKPPRSELCISRFGGRRLIVGKYEYAFMKKWQSNKYGESFLWACERRRALGCTASVTTTPNGRVLRLSALVHFHPPSETSRLTKYRIYSTLNFCSPEVFHSILHP